VPIVLDACPARVDGVLSVTYRFGPYTLDPAAYRLLRDADPGTEVVQLSPKIIDLLLYLVARQPALVSKEDLFKALWPDVAVTDNALTQAVSELRQALGDDSSKPVYVQTVARRGYRFIAPVTTTAPGAQATQSTPSPDGTVPQPVAQLPAIAVLDFANVSGDREWRGSRRASPKPSPTISAPRRPSVSSTACASSSR
jgi:DNA-binding winged helix-turn-helix (wHTH) protein